jgi:hypothetical protein
MRHCRQRGRLGRKTQANEAGFSRVHQEIDGEEADEHEGRVLGECSGDHVQYEVAPCQAVEPVKECHIKGVHVDLLKNSGPLSCGPAV